jgi:cytochrome P450
VVPGPQSLTLEQIDLSDISFWERPWAEREQAFQLLRRESPLQYFEEPDIPPDLSLIIPKGSGYRAVTRHADISEVSRQPEIFASGKGATSIPDMPEELLEFFGSMVNTDNPRHAHLRRIVSAAFSPRMIRNIEDRITQLASEVIDRVAERGRCDFVVDVAARLPLEIIFDMMGIGPMHYESVFRASNVIVGAGNAIVGAGDPEYVAPDVDPLMAIMGAAQQLTSLMSDLADYRRTHPTDDITSALVNTNIDGEALTSAEVASFFILLVVAGNDTTRNAISHGLLALTEHPDQRALWQADPAPLAPTAVDEIIRWGSPIIWMRRTVSQPAVLGGEELEPGDKLLLYYSSANRDEEAFDDPYVFDVRRSPNPHLGFGAAGPHFCLGAHLARQEIAVLFRQLFERLPDIVSSGPPDRLRSTFVNGIKHLECEFTPVAAAS